MSCAFGKTPSISLTCKLVPVQYRGYESGLFWSKLRFHCPHYCIYIFLLVTSRNKNCVLFFSPLQVHLRLWSLLFLHLPLLMIGSRYRAEEPAWACLVGLEGKYLGSGSLVIKAGNKLLYFYELLSLTGWTHRRGEKFLETVESHSYLPAPFYGALREPINPHWAGMHHDPSDVGSLILTRIISKERSQRNWRIPALSLLMLLLCEWPGIINPDPIGTRTWRPPTLFQGCQAISVSLGSSTWRAMGTRLWFFVSPILSNL